MRRCQIIKKIAVLTIALLLISSTVFAATKKEDTTAAAAASSAAAATATQAITDEMLKQALSSVSTGQYATPYATSANAAVSSGTQETAATASAVSTGSLSDPDSMIFKANALSEQRKQDLMLKKTAGTFAVDEVLGENQTPPSLESLQIFDGNTKETADSSDAFLEGDVAKDMRFEAMKNAALSYGARGGLSKRSYEIMEKMDDYAQVLDKVFDFRSLLIKAPSGMLIEPPIIRESLEALVIKEGGKEAAVADSIFDINKNAKIVSAPRDWRHYLIQKWSTKVSPPPKVLLPQNDEEKAKWNAWVREGWEAGVKQAEQIFEMNTDKLASDYRGMVRYRILLAQGMVSAPYTTHEDRGIVGDSNQMRIGDRAIKITEPSRFLTGADIWRPADR